MATWPTKGELPWGDKVKAYINDAMAGVRTLIAGDIANPASSISVALNSRYAVKSIEAVVVETQSTLTGVTIELGTRLSDTVLDERYGSRVIDLSAGNVALTSITAKAYDMVGATATRTVTVPSSEWAASFTNSTDYEQIVLRSGSTVGARIPAGATAELRG